MSFPLAEWIDGHFDCRHNLAISGMIGSIPAPVPSPREVRAADVPELRRRLAEDLAVDPSRVFLSTGASQANALVLQFLARRRRGISSGLCRYCPPEYPPLFDTARWAGYRLTEGSGTADLAVVSQPRNPEGDLWERARLLEWASGARSVLVDETFREFAGARSVVGMDRPGLWATGSFTKFYAADELRVGFLVAPEEGADGFARFHGLVTNLLPPYSVAGALRSLRERERIRAKVSRILRSNVAAARALLPYLRSPVGPTVFDRPVSGESGDSLQQRALAASVLVASGSFFGDPAGVRLCLTRTTFPADLTAYVAVRDRPRSARTRGAERGPLTVGRPARRPRAGRGRARVSPS